jgi:hypothetical protein
VQICVKSLPEKSGGCVPTRNKKYAHPATQNNTFTTKLLLILPQF